MEQYSLTVVSRKGSEVIVRDKFGKLWKTRRKKRKRDSRRRVCTRQSVIHIPIERIIEKGDWLFTCRMEPVQFSHWLNEFEGDDSFETLDGSHHSKRHCSLEPISDSYAAWFIKHELWSLYFTVCQRNFDVYEKKVQEICNIYQIKYEGI